MFRRSVPIPYTLTSKYNGLQLARTLLCNRSMNEKTTAKKVFTPVETKTGKTYWMRIGSAFQNRDGSTNIYLDAYPTNGKLQIRDDDTIGSTADRNAPRNNEYSSHRKAGQQKSASRNNANFSHQRKGNNTKFPF